MTISSPTPQSIPSSIMTSPGSPSILGGDQSSASTRCTMPSVGHRQTSPPLEVSQLPKNSTLQGRFPPDPIQGLHVVSSRPSPSCLSMTGGLTTARQHGQWAREHHAPQTRRRPPLSRSPGLAPTPQSGRPSPPPANRDRPLTRPMNLGKMWTMKGNHKGTSSYLSPRAI